MTRSDQWWFRQSRREAGKTRATRTSRKAFFRKAIQIESLEQRLLLSAQPFEAKDFKFDAQGHQYVDGHVLVGLRTPQLIRQDAELDTFRMTNVGPDGVRSASKAIS